MRKSSGGATSRTLQESEYTLKVKATDGLWQIRTSLFVEVVDQNDNAPHFTMDRYVFAAHSYSVEFIVKMF